MILPQLENFNLILGSRSPRRQQLLSELGLRFTVVVNEWDENFPASLKREEIAVYLASAKAETFRGMTGPRDIVITADTIVWCNDAVLGKPADREDAGRILDQISGNTHEVITGVCLRSAWEERSFFSVTTVEFERLSQPEIEYYISEYQPFDKAGAYGIQEWIGIAACSRIEGSYFNVMGLPVHRLYRELKLLVEGYDQELNTCK